MVANIHSTGRRLLSVSKVAKKFGLSNNTIRNWTNDGTLSCYRTIGNQRRIDPLAVARLLGLDESRTDEAKKVVAYCRVSTHNQSSGMKKGKENSLTRQIADLKKFVETKYGCKAELFSD